MFGILKNQFGFNDRNEISYQHGVNNSFVEKRNWAGRKKIYNKRYNVTKWAIIGIWIVSFLLMHSEVQGDAKLIDYKNKKTVLVTRENFENIKNKLKKNDPYIQALNMEFVVSKKELGGLYQTVQNNKELGYISWDKKQIVWDIVQEIENKLIKNNKDYEYYPNDYMHALLSAHAYIDSQLNDKVVLDKYVLDNNTKNALEDWYVVSVQNDVPNSGYYGVIYRNDKTHQIVLANRGTEGGALGVITDAFSRRQSDWNTNLKEIFIGQIIIGQQARNYQATAEAVKIAEETGYRLSITGHSLGAWLAELSAFYCHAYFRFPNIKAVTFDSPGAVPMMKTLQSNIKNKATQVDLNDIDIVTYLAKPNPVNCANEHLGKVYRIEVEMACSDWLDGKLPDWIKEQVGDKIKGILAGEGHALTGIIPVFDPVTGKPKKYQRMADWPRVQYTGSARDFSETRSEFLKEILKDMGMPWYGAIMGEKAVDYIVGDTTLMTMIDFLLNFQKIDHEQYWAYFEHIDWTNEDKDDAVLSEKLNFDNRFALIAKAKYREDDDRYILHPRKGSIDEYLYDLDKYKNNLKSNKELPKIVKMQLDDLIASFTVEQKSDGQYQLVPNDRWDIEGIRQRTKRLLSVVPGDVSDVLQKVIIKKETVINIGENAKIVDNRILTLSANLPLEVAYYTEIYGKEEELNNKLAEDQVVVISGAGGMGKSTLAARYGKNQKAKGWHVRWLKGTQIDEEFLKLAKELYIATENLRPNEVKDLVYKGLEKLIHGRQILLIFDNVEDEDKLKEYLINLPNQAEVIITARNSNLLKGIYSNVELKGFAKKEAIGYLMVALEKNEKAAEKLLATIGESPFRLSKAVIYLKNHSVKTLDEFIQEYETIKKGHKHNEEIYPEIELLFRDLKKHSLEGWQLLQYLAYLDAEGVSVQLISDILNGKKDGLQASINQLEALSLITIVTEGNQKRLKVSHRIVQDETKKALIEEDKTQTGSILEKLVSELNKALPYFDRDSKNFEGAIELIRHTKVLLQEISGINSPIIGREDLLSKVGSYHCEIVFDSKEIMHYWKELLNYRQMIHQGDHSNVADSLSDIGYAYMLLGEKENIEIGLKYHEDALKMRKNLFSSSHVTIANSLKNIGYAYMLLGEKENFYQALKYYNESLEMFKELFPGNDLNVADLLDSIGIVYQLLEGEKNNAFKYFEEALQIKESLLARNHPIIGDSLFNMIGSSMGKKENIAKLFKHLEIFLNMQKGILLINSENIVHNLRNVGLANVIFVDTNKISEYLKQAYSIYSLSFREDHKSRNRQIRRLIEYFEPNFFIEQGLRETLSLDDCLGGNRVGFECRLIILSRGETNNALMVIKRKIQAKILTKIVQAVDDLGWSSINFLGIDYGVKGFLEKKFIERTWKIFDIAVTVISTFEDRTDDLLAFKEMDNDANNIELAQMLCFEAMNLGIMKSAKKPYELAELFTREYPELVKKIAEEHPEFFIDGSIVEACIRAMPDDESFQKHIIEHVKYMGMDERREAGFFNSNSV